jgi:hypothetical protein
LSPHDQQTEIRTVDEWFDRAAPAGGKRHWREGRSAMEIARLWCGSGLPTVPGDVSRVLESQPHLSGARITAVIPEWKTGLRGEARGPRNHDLVLFAETQARRVLIGVEAKTDEPLDAPLSVRVAKAKAGLAADPPIPTKQLIRVRRLTEALFGVCALDEADEVLPDFTDLPYQLVSAVAGTLIEAEERKADIAMLLIHALRGDRLDVGRIATNELGYRHLLRLLSGDRELEPEEGVAYGPYVVAGGGGVPRIPLYLALIASPMAGHTVS